MKVLLGLLGYSCKIHRKRSKSSLNRLSFTETDEHRFERGFSSEEKTLENDIGNAHSKVDSIKSEPAASTSGAEAGTNNGEENDLPSSHQTEKPKDELPDQREGRNLCFYVVLVLFISS